MSDKRRISLAEARSVGTRLGLDWARIELEQFRRGLEVELNLGSHDSEAKITDAEVLLTGRIVWIHLKRVQDYYTRSDRLEVEAKERTKSCSRCSIDRRLNVDSQRLPAVAFTAGLNRTSVHRV